MDFRKIYATNEDAKLYVDRYCKEYNTSVDSALTHYLVRETLLMYDEKKKARGEK